MNRRRRSGTLAIGVLLLTFTGAFGAGVAPGAPPTIVREEINETFVEETLSEACGVTANVRLTGFAIVREREGGGVLEVVTISATGVVTSEFGSFRVKDVGSNSTRVTRDGQVIVSLRGQLPFFIKGVLKFDDTTGEWLNEPNFAASERQIQRACAVLNPEG
jgi:hypothetical protein